jgi:zinc protease
MIALAFAAAVVALPPNAHPTVSLAVRFRAGAVDDPVGKAGLTDLTARLMAEGGTRTLDAKQLLRALYPMAAKIDARVDKELTSFTTTVHTDHVAKMMPIFTEVVAHPRWDESEFRRLRDAAMNAVEKQLRQARDEDLGKEALAELMYREHPYGRLTRGRLQDLKSITLAEVQAHAAKIFTKDRMVIGVAGGYKKPLLAALEKALATLPDKGATFVAVHPAGTAPHQQAAASHHNKSPAGKPRVLLVEKEAQATAISLGFPYTLSRKSQDFAAMTVARSAFGEHRQFNGRLMQRLREARGLNYGDYAYIEYFEQEGGDAVTAQTGRARTQQDFTIWIRPVQNENRLFALRAALRELSRSLAEEPFSEAEVTATKGFLDGYMLLYAQTDERKLGFALDDHFLGLENFLDKWRAGVRAVTAAQVNAAWKKHVAPDKLQIAMAGPGAAELKQQILAGAPSPIQYPRDQKGEAPPKPKEVLEADAEIEKFPLGVRGEDDVEVVPVRKLFESSDPFLVELKDAIQLLRERAYDESARALTKSKSLAGNNVERQATVMFWEATFAIDRDDLAKAIQILDGMAELGRTHPDTFVEYTAQNAKTWVLWAQGDLKAARAACDAQRTAIQRTKRPDDEKRAQMLHFYWDRAYLMRELADLEVPARRAAATVEAEKARLFFNDRAAEFRNFDSMAALEAHFAVRARDMATALSAVRKVKLDQITDLQDLWLFSNALELINDAAGAEKLRERIRDRKNLYAMQPLLVRKLDAKKATAP